MVTTGGLSLGVGSIDPVGAQTTDAGRTGTADDGGAEGDPETRTGFMFHHEYHPGAQFRVLSPPIRKTPDLRGDGVERDEAVLDAHHLRMVEYVNTGEQAQLFLPQGAQVERGKVYELARIFSTFETSPAKGLISVEFDPVPDEDVLFDDDDEPGWEPGQDFEVLEGGGSALISGYRFYPGALFRVTSGVIEWIPREQIRRAADSVDYNTRLAEYVGTEMSFVFYPAEGADVDRGAVYVMRESARIVDPGGRFHSIEFSQVDEEDLDEDLLQSRDTG